MRRNNEDVGMPHHIGSIPDLIKKYSTQPTQTLIPLSHYTCKHIQNIFIRALNLGRHDLKTAVLLKNTVNAGRETEEVG